MKNKREKWEYRIDRITVANDVYERTKIGEVLQRRGLQGWELCGLIPMPKPVIDVFFWAVFKRTLSKAPGKSKSNVSNWRG